MKHSLQLRLSQHLTLTPQLQQSIRLLQLSTLELNQELEKFLQENPLLERDDGMPRRPRRRRHRRRRQPEYASASSTDSTGERRPTTAATTRNAAMPTGSTRTLRLRPARATTTTKPSIRSSPPSTQTLREHLICAAVADQAFRSATRALVTLLIEALDDDGYLHQDLDELADTAAAGTRKSTSMNCRSRCSHLQNLDPTGVGARTLAECLELQLEGAAGHDAVRARWRSASSRNHLDALAARDFAKLKKLLHCDDDGLRGVQHLIQSLNPRPGAAIRRARRATSCPTSS